MTDNLGIFPKGQGTFISLAFWQQVPQGLNTPAMCHIWPKKGVSSNSTRSALNYYWMVWSGQQIIQTFIYFSGTTTKIVGHHSAMTSSNQPHFELILEAISWFQFCVYPKQDAKYYPKSSPWTDQTSTYLHLSCLILASIFAKTLLKQVTCPLASLPSHLVHAA